MAHSEPSVNPTLSCGQKIQWIDFDRLSSAQVWRYGHTIVKHQQLAARLQAKERIHARDFFPERNEHPDANPEGGDAFPLGEDVEFTPLVDMIEIHGDSLLRKKLRDLCLEFADLFGVSLSKEAADIKR